MTDEDSRAGDGVAETADSGADAPDDPDGGASIADPRVVGSSGSDGPVETDEPVEAGLLLDVMLGKLATYLRMCGYDAAYAGDRGAESDDDALALAHTEGRLLVTRDRELAERAERSLLLSGREVLDQLEELAEAGFDLDLPGEPARCSACNGPVERVDRTEPTPDYAPATFEQTVWRCRDCGQHFWKGSHWADVASTLDEL